MAGQEVRVKVGLDTSAAEAQFAAFFKKIGSQKAQNPFKGMDKELESVGKSAEGAAKGLGDMADKAKNAGQATKGVGSGAATEITKIGTAATNANTNLGTLATGAKTLGSAMANVGKSKPLVPIATSLKNLNSVVPSSVQAFGSLGTAIKNAGQGNTLQAVGGSLTGLNGPLSSATKGVDGLGKELDETGGIGEQFAGSIVSGFDSIAKGIPVGIGIALANSLIAPLETLVGILPAAVSEFQALEESISGTVAILGGGASEFKALQDSILNVSSATAATATEVGAVAQALSRAGFSLEEVDNALGPIVQGAEATGTAYENMGNIVVNAIGAFGKEAGDAADIVDTLTVAANSSNQSVDDLGEALKYVGPVANTTGQELDDVGVALGVLANAGIKGSQAGTSFRTILTNLQIAASGAGSEFTELTKGSARLEKALKLIGGNMTDANGELLKGEELIGELQRAMSGLSTGEKALVSKALAGNEGLPALNVLINASKDEVSGLADALDNRAGAAAAAANTALSGLSGSFKILNSNISAFLTQVGSLIAVVLKPLVDAATGVLSIFNKLPGPIKTLVTAVGLLAGAFVALNVALAITGTLAKSTFGTQLAAQIGAVTTAVKGLTLQQMINNFGVLATTVKGAVVTAFSALGGAIGGVITWFKGLTLASIASGFTSLASSISGAVVSAFVGLKGAVAAAWTSLVAAAPAMAAFAAAAAPFVAIGAGVAAVIIAIKRNMDAYKSVADPLAESQDTLNKSLEPTQEAAEGNAKAWKSWGDRLSEWAGPFGRILEMVVPGVQLFKQLLNLLGWIDNINRNTAAINAANDAYREFQAGIDQGNAKIAKNMQLINNSTPGTEAYGRAVAENEKIIKGQSQALDQRIKALDSTIKKMKEDEGANDAAIQRLEALKGKYEEQKVSIDANKESIIAMRVESEQLTGRIDDWTLAMNNAAEARENLQAKADAQAYYTEIQNLEDLKQGLISEETARARTLTSAQKMLDERVQIANDEIDAIKEAKARGLINEREYTSAMATATADLAETLKERAENENALAKATEAAINKRLTDMNNEVTQIQSNAQAVASALQGIFSIQGSGYQALAGLVNQITQLQITKIDQVKSKRIEAIDKEEEKALRAIERQGKASKLSDEQINAQKEAAEQNFQRQRDQAEKAYEAAKKKAIADQIRLQNQINQAAFAGKQAELGLWYTQQRIQNEIAQVQTEIEIAKAKAAGDSKAVELLTTQLNLQKELGNQLPGMYKLKKDILGIENDTKTAALATKAEAEGINAAYLGQIPTMNNIETKLQSLKTSTEGMAKGLEPFKVGLQEIPRDVEGAVQEVKDQINGINDVTFDNLVNHFTTAMGLTTEAAEIEAGKIVTWYDQAGAEAGDIAAKNIYDRFGDTIPAPLIKDQLIQAMRDGSNLSLKEAEVAYAKLGAAIPKEDVAMILGRATGEGVEKGIQILRDTPIPDAMNIFGGSIQTGMGQAGEEGNKNILQKLTDGTGSVAKAIGNWFLVGFEQGIDEQEAAVKTMGTNIEKDKGIRDGLSSNIEEGSKQGAERGSQEITEVYRTAAEDGASVMQGVMQDRSESIATPLGESLTKVISESVKAIEKAIQESIKEMQQAFAKLADEIDTKNLTKKMNDAIKKPIDEAKETLGGFTIAPNIAEAFSSIASDASSIGNAGLKTEFRSVASDTRTAANSARSLASYTRSLVGPANAYAAAMRRAANEAARAARSRWSGGPVQGGQAYTVNELGPEMFMNKAGNISDIKAPAFGKWRAPSSGTVIPAHLAQQIRSQREAANVASAAAAANLRSSSNISGFDGGGLTGAIAKGFKGVNMGGGQVVNNVQLTTQSPVSDASKILTDLARIKAQRRR